MTVHSPKSCSRVVLRFIGTATILGALAILGAIGAVLLARLLVVNAPQRSDVILVLAGDRGDWRYQEGLDLLHEGYAPYIVLDADAAYKKYGESWVELATEFVDRTAPGHSSVCPITGDSTDIEAHEAAPCLARLNPHSVLLVTSDFHTRRALSIFRKRLPQYHWSVAAAPDPDFSDPQKSGYRERAKIAVQEWQKYVWWKLVEQWQSHP